MKCYVDDVEAVIKDGFDHYAFSMNGKPVPVFPPTSPWECDKETHAMLVRLRDLDHKRVTIDGKSWLRENIDVQWEFGPLNNAQAPHSESLEGYDREKKWFRHIHTTFSFAGHEIHADYLMRRSGGPMSGFEEIRYYVDGVFVARGGLFVVVPAGKNTRYPSALKAPDFAIIGGHSPGDGEKGRLKNGRGCNYDFAAWRVLPE